MGPLPQVITLPSTDPLPFRTMVLATLVGLATLAGPATAAPTNSPRLPDVATSGATAVSAGAGRLAAAETAPARPVAAAASLPRYRSGVREVTAADLGETWNASCPMGPSRLRLVTVSYVDFHGQARIGELVVHQGLVYSVRRIFQDLYDQRFPIRRIETMDRFHGDDDRSMAWDNTSAFNCRRITGGSGWSRHAWGVAIDLNPRENPYVRGSTILPPDGAPYVDRDRDAPGMVHAGSPALRAFTSRGYEWGGAWRTLKDYQHLER